MTSTTQSRAMTLIEILVVVAVIGIVAAVAIPQMGGIGTKTRESRLHSDVTTLNRTIKVYLASGGNLDHLTSGEAVLSALKTELSAADARTQIGLSRRFVDPRMTGVLADDSEIGSLRAVWNPGSQQFELRDRGAGIKEFAFNDALAEVDFGTEKREGSIMSYNHEEGWIWSYEERMPTPDLSAPTVVQIDSVPNDPFPTASAPPPARERLTPPTFSVASSSHSITDFDLPVLLTDPNENGAAQLYYSIDYGDWQVFDGSPILVPPGGVVQAQSIPVDEEAWLSSSMATNTYRATPVELETPSISGSVSTFGPDADSSTITITDPNSPDISKTVYQIDGGSWTDYSGPFTLSSDDHPTGTTVVAKSVPIGEYYLDSGSTAFAIIGSPTQLEAPQIIFSEDSFNLDEGISSIQVSLNNPNPTGSSIVSYQIVPVPGGVGATTGFQDYTGPFTIRQAFYPSGFGIQAFTKSLSPQHEDSEMTSRFATTEEGVFGGHLDLDTAIVENAEKYSIDVKHTHDYTGKHNVSKVDFFALNESKQYEILEGIPTSSQKFKLLVSNGSLSPGMLIVIRQERNGVEERFALPVTVYDDIPLGELTVFSLDGSNGSARLLGLEAVFGQDVITTAGALPTTPGSVIGNDPGRNNEYRNGALTFQAVAVTDDGSPHSPPNQAISNGGVHGVATSGLLWEAMLYWHWTGDSYDDPDNPYKPGDPTSVEGFTSSQGGK